MNAVILCAVANLFVASSFAPVAISRRRPPSGARFRTERAAASGDAVALLSILDDQLKTAPDGVAATVQCVADACAQTSTLLGRASLDATGGESLVEMAAKLFETSLVDCPGVCATAIQWPGRALSFTEAAACNGGLVVVATPLDCGAGTGADPSACAGSVFAVYEATPSRGELALGVLPGGQRSLVASGYCVYSSSTQLVLAVKGGVPNAFTLDPTTQTFVCSEEGLLVPSKGKTLVIDYGCAPGWPRPLVDFVRDAEAGLVGGKPFGSRFSGSTVADVHRIISTGGCFCHPAAPGCGPGLPFLSMAAPLAFVAEHAGGRVLCRAPGTTEDSTPLAASSPLYLGSEAVISALAGYLDRAPAHQKEMYAEV